MQRKRAHRNMVIVVAATDRLIIYHRGHDRRSGALVQQVFKELHRCWRLLMMSDRVGPFLKFEFWSDFHFLLPISLQGRLHEVVLKRLEDTPRGDRGQRDSLGIC